MIGCLMFAHKKPRKRHWWEAEGKAKAQKTSSNAWERERSEWNSVYPGQVVREGWKKFGGRRKSTRVTLTMRNTLSDKVCGVHC